MASHPFTVGVELELQLLDRTNGTLVSRAQPILAKVTPQLQAHIVYEVFESMLEIRSRPALSIQALEEDLRGLVEVAGRLAAEEGAVLFAAALNPTAAPEAYTLTRRPAYLRHQELLQQVMNDFVGLGLHVHIGLEGSHNMAVRVLNGIQAFLPLLLAASASSPFFHGRDTGFASYRTPLFSMLPAAGIYGYMPSWQKYREEIGILVDLGIHEHLSEVMWDARLKPKLGTVEIRICDMPCRLSVVLALAACIQALVAELVGMGEDFGPLSYSLLRANKFQASRYGLQGLFGDPSGELENKEKLRIDAALLRLLAYLEQTGKRLGGRHYLESFATLIENGTGADEMRRRYQATGSLRATIEETQRHFLD